MARVGWDTYFIQIADVVKERATCNRLKVGSLIVKDSRVLSTGYNGSVVGEPHCEDVGCLMDKGSCVRTIHAELNAILNGLSNGVNLEGSTIYVTHFPCFNCAKHIVQAGIKRVVYKEDYRNDYKAIELFNRNEIQVRKVK